jgi:hypothetical protein
MGVKESGVWGSGAVCHLDDFVIYTTLSSKDLPLNRPECASQTSPLPECGADTPVRRL